MEGSLGERENAYCASLKIPITSEPGFHLKKLLQKLFHVTFSVVPVHKQCFLCSPPCTVLCINIGSIFKQQKSDSCHALRWCHWRWIGNSRWRSWPRPARKNSARINERDVHWPNGHKMYLKITVMAKETERIHKGARIGKIEEN